MHMLSKKDLSSDELETLLRSRNPAVVVTAKGEVRTIEEAQAYVHDVGLFITCIDSKIRLQFYHLESSAKKSGIPMSGQSGSKPRLTQNGRKILFKTDNFVPLVFPGMSSNSGARSFSTSPPQDSSSTSSNPGLQRSDEQAPGDRRDSTKSQNKTKRRATIRQRETVCEIFWNG